MPDTGSQMEERIAQFLDVTPSAARLALGRSRVDVVYLSEADQDRLENYWSRE